MDEMRIVMLGKKGVGKSSLANTILGENVFPIGHTGNSETRECRSETRRVDVRDVTLIDTPGLFDTCRSEEELKPEIVKCITECSPGPHAFLIVFKVERFTDQEQEVINKINQYFSEEAFKYATVLFTHGDQLEEGQTIEQYFHNNHLMSDLMKKCGGRYHVVDNKYWKNNQPYEYRCNQFQVKQLMKTIDHMIEENNGSCFTNEMLQDVEKLRLEEAKKRVSRLLIELAGVTTGALIGALIGAFLGNILVVGVLTVFQQSKSVLESRAQGGATVGVGGGDGVVAGADTAGTTAGWVIGAGVLAAAIKGGFTGYDAAEEAGTASEAVKRAAKAVFHITSIF